MGWGLNCLTFGKGLLATGSLGEELLALGDGLATEADTLLGVEDGTLPDQALDATGTTVYLVKSDLIYDLRAMLPKKLPPLACRTCARVRRQRIQT